MKDAVIIYTDTISPEAVDRYVRQWSREEQRAYGRKRRRWILEKQRIAGIILFAITIPAIKLLNGDATIAVITVPVGIALVCSA